jgi:hypothetical protein
MQAPASEPQDAKAPTQQHRASAVFLQYDQNKGKITRGKDRFFFSSKLGRKPFQLNK